MIDDSSKIALIDLDGTLANYEKAIQAKMLLMKAPEETWTFEDFEYSKEPSHIKARRKLIQSQPAFWHNLEPIKDGFDILNEIRIIGFQLHILTKGPKNHSLGWSEKVDWATKHIPDAEITITQNKSIAYGRVLFDDFPPYFLEWLKFRPRGLVVSIKQSWNKEYWGNKHSNIIVYDGTNLKEVKEKLQQAYDR